MVWTMDSDKGKTWGALRKAWKGYRIAKVQQDEKRMKEWALKIIELQKALDIPTATFPSLRLEQDQP